MITQHNPAQPGATAPVVVNVPINDLKPDPWNPRRISDSELDALTRSLREFGILQPVIVRKADNTVIGGHQRLLAAKRLGYTEVPVIFVDLSLEQARVLNLALNKIAGTWDDQLLARLMKDLEAAPGADLSLTGFEDDEIKKLLRSLDAREKRERPEHFDLDEALEAAKREPRTKPGDVWQLGEHRVLCGDSAADGALGRLLGNRRADLCFSDPPYGVRYAGGATGKRKQIANDDLAEAFYPFLLAVCQHILAVTDGAVYLCMSSSELHTLQRAFLEAGGHWSTWVIWAKDAFTLGRSDYQRQYEPILFGWREGAKRYWCGARDQGDVWQIAKPDRSPLHPTMKPLALIERAIENSSRPDDLVLDPFLGSGSTLIAAERTGRVCYGVELDPLYCDVIVGRWEAFTEGKAAKLAVDEAAPAAGRGAAGEGEGRC